MTPLLRTGSAVSRYRVVSFLGAGGMGEVYKAHDPMLDRAVALKILPPGLLTSDEAIRRFIHEAKTASALNHPHIVTIHEIGTTDAGADAAPMHYIAMELIDGESLRQKIGTTLGVPRMLDLLIQVAEGVSKAHGAGVIHRDLKPDNVMVSADGYAKVVDFGLAKLVEGNVGRDAQPNDVTTPIGLTRRGMAMGTIGYMAPEQIEEQLVDERSDIFSFGCVLYEAIAGRHPFKASTVSETLRRIVHDSPAPLAQTKADTPADLERIVRKCLAKNPDERYQTMRDVVVDLREVRRQLTSGTPVAPAPRASKKKLVGIVLATAALLVFAALIASRFLRKPTTVPDESYTISQITTEGTIAGADVSPDGRYIAYTTRERGKSTIFLRLLNGDSAVRLIGPDERRHFGVRFSGDGNHLYFSIADHERREFSVHRIPVLGGTSERVLNDMITMAVSSPDGTKIIFGRHDAKRTPHVDEVNIANADGTEQRLLTTVQEPRAIDSATWSYDGKHLLWIDSTFRPRIAASVVEYELATGKSRTLSSGWDRISAVRPQDPSTLIVLGRKSPAEQMQIWEVRLPEGRSRRLTNDASGYTFIQLPRSGAFIVAAKNHPDIDLWQITDSGAKQITTGTGAELSIRCSSSETIIYTRVVGDRVERRARNIETGIERSVGTTSYAGAVVPTPDGTEVVFPSEQSGGLNLWRVKLDGSAPVQLTRLTTAIHPDVTPDGQTVVFAAYDEGSPMLWKVPLRGGNPVPISRMSLTMPAVSPDGRSVVAVHMLDPEKPRIPTIVSIDSGEVIGRVPLPPTGSPYTMRWTRDGKSLAYIDTRDGVSNIWAVPLDGGKARQLTSFTDQLITSFDFAADGSLFCTRGKSTTDLYLLKRESP